MIPDATMVNTTMKSILDARVSSSQHNPSHSSRMHPNLIILPVVIASLSFVDGQKHCLPCAEQC